MSFNSKQLLPEFAEKFEPKEPSKFKIWWDSLPDEHILKEVSQSLRFKYRLYISDPWYDTKHGIRNLFRYFNVVWNDRSWDYLGVYHFTERKLELLYEALTKNPHTYQTAEICRDIKLAINLIKKVKNDEYEMEYTDYEKRKFDFEPTEDGKYYTLNSDIIWEKWDEYLNKHKSVVRRIVKKETEVPSKEDLVRMVGDYNQERAKRILFNLLRDSLHLWWD